MTVAGKPIDLRVSCLPTAFGESIVLRVLDRSSISLDLDSLGLPKYVFDFVSEVIQRPNGIFVVTGRPAAARRPRCIPLAPGQHH